MDKNESKIMNTGKDRKKTIALTAAAAGLVLAGGAALTFGGISAYLSDADTATNTFTVGEVKIDTTEPNFPGNGSDEVSDLNSLEKVKKDPQIKNTGKNKAIVFIQVDIPMAQVITADYTGLRLNNGEKVNTELFNYRIADWLETQNDGFNSINEDEGEWTQLIMRDRFGGPNLEPADKADAGSNLMFPTAKDPKARYVSAGKTNEERLPSKDGVLYNANNAAYVQRLYGYTTVLDEDETTMPIFDEVRMCNLVEGQIDNSTQSIIITSYAIQAENIADLTTADQSGIISNELLQNVWDVYVNQTKDGSYVTPGEADDKNDQTIKNSTLNVTMTVANTHLKLNTGNVADARTTTSFHVAYTGSGTAPTPVFQSENTNVATVDQNGNIQAVGVGETVITMTAINPDNGKEAVATVTVQVRDVNSGSMGTGEGN